MFRSKKRICLIALLAAALILSALAVVGYAANDAKKVTLREHDYQNGKLTGFAGKAWAMEEMRTNGDGNIYSASMHRSPDAYVKKSDGTYDLSGSFYDIKVLGYGTSASQKKICDYKYLTVDFDFMTETGWYYEHGSIGMSAITRSYIPEAKTDANGVPVPGITFANHSSNNMRADISKVSDATSPSGYKWVMYGDKANDFTENGAYKWQHISFVLDVSFSEENGYYGSKYYIYLNGDLIESGDFFRATADQLNDPSNYYNGDISLIYFDTIRVEHAHNTAITASGYKDNYSLCVDNVVINGYEAGYKGEVEPVFDSSYEMPRGFVVASVDGKFYDDHATAAAAINAASEEIKIYEDFPDTALVVDGPISIETNGHTLSYSTKNGYYAVDEGDGKLSFINKYTVKWHFGDSVTEEIYTVGDTPIPPYVTEAGKTITVNGETHDQLGGWSKTDGGAPLSSLPAVSENAEYFAAYDKKAYYFSYKESADGEVKYFTSDDIGKESPTEREISTAINTKLDSLFYTNRYMSVSLMSDVTIHSAIHTYKSASSTARATQYFDLAGFTMTYYNITANQYNTSTGKYISYGGYFSGSSKGFSFLIGSYCDFYCYSSKPGGKLYNSVYTVATYDQNGNIYSAPATGTVQGSGLFSIGSATKHATLNLGTVTMDGATYSGSNLACYTSTLVYSYGDTTCTMNVDGGEYYKSVSDQGALIVTDNNLNISLKNATIASNGYPIFRTYTNKTYALTVDVDNCILYTTSKLFSSWYTGAVLKIKNSYVYGNLQTDGGTVLFDSGVRLLTGTTNTSGAVTNTGIELGIKTAEFFSTTFNFNSFSYTLNESDRRLSVYNKAESEATVPTNYSSYIGAITAAPDSYSIVSWTYNGATTNPEKWFHGVVPTCPFSLDDGHGYKFTVKGLKPAVGGETVNYVIEQKADIPMLMNISLYADFIYNIYIPTEYSDIIVGALLNGHSETLASTVTIGDGEYYLLQLPITAANGASSFDLALTLKGHEGKSFTDTYTLSIPKYAYTVLDGNYAESTKTLMRSTLTYIKAACSYFGTACDGIGDVEAPGTASSLAMGNVPDSVAEVFGGAQLYLGGEIRFRFSIITDKDFEATFTYRDSSENANVTKTITQSDVSASNGAKYYDIALRAYDLRSDINVTVGGETFTYCLANYVHFVKDHPTLSSNTKLNYLLDSLWSYSIAATGFDAENGHTHLESVTICGTPIEKFSIVANTVDEENAAAVLRYQIYLKTGYELPIVKDAVENAIFINHDINGVNDFAVSVADGDLIFNASLSSFILDGMMKFTGEYINTINSTFDFGESFSAAYATRFISYKDVGAVGDGIADDHDAMKLAHDLAAAKGYSIKVNDGTYNVGQHKAPIIIRTDVDWTGATIITDDSKIKVGDPGHTAAIFTIPSEYSTITHSADSELVKKINAAGGINDDILAEYNGTFFGHTPGYRAMLVPYDSTHKVYIRYGGNANNGSSQHELIIIEEDGRINEDTPFLLDYSNVSYIYEYRVDDTPITITGGKIITIANQAECNYDYYSRNISISRSNTTIRGFEHVITGEGPKGAPYSGMLSISNCTDFLAEDCKLQAHRYYVDEEYDKNGKVIGYGTSMGTYDISGGGANNMYFKNCVQTNFNTSNTWYDENGNTGIRNNSETASAGIWGIMGTNWCKNITYDGSKLNRLDAHSGVVNASVINGSEVTTIAAIGGGMLTVKDSTVHGGDIIGLRTDYGSTWNGDLLIENVDYYNTTPNPVIINGTWSNHYFGYTTYTPQNITINNLRYMNVVTTPYMFSNFISSSVDSGNLDGNGNPIKLTGVTPTFDISGKTFTYGGKSYTNLNPMVMPKSISISNIKNANGANIPISSFKGSSSNTYLNTLLDELLNR